MHMGVGEGDGRTPELIVQARPHSYVDVHCVRDAGHHVHADQPFEFNRIVKQVLSLVDCDGDLPGKQTVTDNHPSLSETH